MESYSGDDAAERIGADAMHELLARALSLLEARRAHLEAAVAMKHPA
jgi:hypothetical protein